MRRENIRQAFSRQQIIAKMKLLEQKVNATKLSPIIQCVRQLKRKTLRYLNKSKAAARVVVVEVFISSFMGTSFVHQIKPVVKEAFSNIFIKGAKLFCYGHVINTYLCTFGWAVGPSMLPTINPYGTLILQETLSTRFGKAGQGDVVLLRSSKNPNKCICKRIVATEGQTVTYLVNPKEGNQEKTLIVPKGHIWIEGDNKSNSIDSRVFGPVPYGLLQGRAFWKVWPLEEFGPLDQVN